MTHLLEGNCPKYTTSQTALATKTTEQKEKLYLVSPDWKNKTIIIKKLNFNIKEVKDRKSYQERTRFEL